MKPKLLSYFKGNGDELTRLNSLKFQEKFRDDP